MDGIWIKPASQGTIVKDSEFSNYGSGAITSNGIAGEGTFLRNDIFHVENGIDVFGPSRIQGNYIHDMKAAGEPHYDGIEINGGTRRHDPRTTRSSTTSARRSAVMIDNDFSPVSNIIVDGNFLAGGGYTVYSDGRFDGGPITGVQFINNVMGKGHCGLLPHSGTTAQLVRQHRPRDTSLREQRRHALRRRPRFSADSTDATVPIRTRSELRRTRTHAGDDVYTVPGDTVNEQPGQGTDKVESTVSYTLAANVENLQLDGQVADQRHRQRARQHDHRQRRRQHSQRRRRQRHAQRLGRQGHVLWRGRQRRVPVHLAVQRRWRQDHGFRAWRRQARLQQDRRELKPIRRPELHLRRLQRRRQHGHLWPVEDSAAGVTDLYARTSTFQFHIEIKGTGLGISASDFVL